MPAKVLAHSLGADSQCHDPITSQHVSTNTLLCLGFANGDPAHLGSCVGHLEVRMQSADREPHVAEAKQPIATQRLVQPQTLGFSRSPPRFSCAMKTLRCVHTVTWCELFGKMSHSYSSFTAIWCKQSCLSALELRKATSPRTTLLTREACGAELGGGNLRMSTRYGR